MNHIAEADRLYALALGIENRDRAWVLSDRDVWYANPFYSGPPVPHPEYEWDGTDEEYREMLAEARRKAKPADDYLKYADGMRGVFKDDDDVPF